MPNPNGHRCSPTVFVHMTTVVVAIIRRILCLSFGCQIDLMQRMRLKLPMKHRTSLGHKLAKWSPTNVILQMHWNCVAMIPVCLTILSSLWPCTLALLYPNATLSLRRTFGPRIPCNSLRSIRLSVKECWRCWWDSHRLSIRFLRNGPVHLLSKRCWKFKGNSHEIAVCCFQFKFLKKKSLSLTTHCNCHEFFPFDWTIVLCGSIERRLDLVVVQFPSRMTHNRDNNHHYRFDYSRKIHRNNIA